MKKEQIIQKYKDAKKSQAKFKKKTPLTRVTQHTLLDQNIHIFDEIIKDLQSIETEQESEEIKTTIRQDNVCHNFYADTKSTSATICHNCGYEKYMH